MVAACLVLAAALALVHAEPQLVVRQSLQASPNGFVRMNAAPSNTVLNLRIALVSNNLAGLEKTLYDVSTPGSPKYGKYLTKDQVKTFVAPSTNTTNAVNEWLSVNGLKVSSISPAGDWLSFSVDVKKANKMLNADFSVFTHKDTGHESIRTLSYSIPPDLDKLVAFVHPTTAFPQLISATPRFIALVPQRDNHSSEGVPASCATLVTPACLQAQYGLPPMTSEYQTASQIAVSGFIDQFAQQSDLTSFIEKLRPDLPPGTTFSLQTLDGGSNPQGPSNAGIEANLDIQYTVGVAGGVPTTFISVGSNNNDSLDGFLDIINFLIGEASPPKVMTTSYGFDEPGITSDIATSLCNAYMQLGARGVTILLASGDGGVAGSQSQNCTSFIPTFPSGCPFLTSVGATTGINPEVAANFSSGGFSNLFPRPLYQKLAVEEYLLRLGSTNQGRFNRSGRAFPDVAAQGENVVIFDGGQEGTVAGTSCSSPIFASTIALLNAELIAAGKPVLGFLNPFIYKFGSFLMTDITSGNNPGCGTGGFPALTGWDPLTGFGTPNYHRFKELLGLGL